MRFEIRGKRLLAAEILVVTGGTLLVVAYFLPLVHWSSVSGASASASILASDMFRDVVNGYSTRERFVAFFALCFFFGPHLLGFVVAADAATSRLSSLGLQRTWRMGLRCVLYAWLAGGVLLPMIAGSELEPEMQVICILVAGTVIIGWLVLGRWWQPRSHAAFMRLGRLLGAILAGIWVGYYLGATVHALTATVVTALTGSALVVAGSVPGLSKRLATPADEAPA